MGMPLQQLRFDASSYLAWEAGQAERHEFVDGEIYAMTGARDSHNRVALNLAAALKSALRGTPCRTFMTDMKLRVDAVDAYFYPDIFVTCDERDRRADADLMKRHPRLIVEVLSDSTGAYDRGRKFEIYRGIETLSEVLFVSADRRQVDLLRRQPDGDSWVLFPKSAADTLQLASLDVELPLDAVYDDVVG